MKKGQALVVVLLVMAVAATIGLSIASRSTSQVSVSTTQDESSRALEAAEVGVEQALGGYVTPGVAKVDSVTNLNASYLTNNNQISGKDIFEDPITLWSGDAVYVDLRGYTNNKIKICWGNSPETGITPAIEVVFYYSSGGFKTVTVGYDYLARFGFTNSGVSTTGNNCHNAVNNYMYREVVGLTGPGDLAPGATPIALRIRMIANTTGQFLAVDGLGVSLPVQANNISATGQSGATTQKLHVTQLNPDYQGIFDSALFSGAASGITK